MRAFRKLVNKKQTGEYHRQTIYMRKKYGKLFETKVAHSATTQQLRIIYQIDSITSYEELNSQKKTKNVR